MGRDDGLPPVAGAGRDRPVPRNIDIAHQVLRSIRQIVRRISEHSRSLSRGVGLTVPQLMCLKAIGELEESEAGEITVARISQQVHVTPATVSRIIDRLVRAGLVNRARQARDRRKVCLSLTTAGLERFAALPVPLQERFVTRLMALGAEERLTLLSALQRISELMEATQLDAAPLLTPGEDIGTEPSDPE